MSTNRPQATDETDERNWEVIEEVASWDPETFPAARHARRILKNAGREVPGQ